MILVDTSVWIDHLRRRNPALVAILERGDALVHPFILGELVLGHLSRRDETLALLLELPEALPAQHDEVFELVTGRGLTGSGIGWVDAHLLASTLLTRGRIWTLDRTLHAQAERLGIAL